MVKQQQLVALADELESSFFVYDLDGLNEHLKLIQQYSFPGLRLWYACKANPLSAILKSIKEAGFGIDVASMGELEHTKAQGFSGTNTLATGPAKSKKYLQRLLSAGVGTIVCESLNQVRWLNEVAQEMGTRPDILLRVQLDWEEGSSVLGGNDITPFGIDLAQWQQLTVDDYKSLNLLGFHVFQWGNILEIERLEAIWTLIMERMNEFANQLDLESAIIDLGGGLGIPYSETEERLDFADVAALLQQLKSQFGFNEIWLELGRYIVGDYGQYVTQVIDRKAVRGKELLITEGGMNHIARPALTGQPFPCQNLRDSLQPNKSFQIHGPLCTALDKLGTLDLPEDTAPGDWLVMHQTGAYGMTESMPYFLCHDLPAEVVTYQGKVDIIQPTQTAAAWIR